MRRLLSFATFVAVVLSAAASAAQTTDPSGHWMGAIQLPGGEMTIEIDLVRTSEGAYAATMSNAAQNLKGLPLSNVAVEGRAVRFAVGSAGGAFEGTLSGDGQTLAGTVAQSVYSVPFRLTRAGDAVVAAAVPRSAAISQAMAGTWRGTLEIEGRSLGFVVTLTNHADGTASGSWRSLEEGIELPVVLAQNGSTITVRSEVTGGSYTGTLNAAGTELSGSFAQGPLELPLVFRRQPAADR